LTPYNNLACPHTKFGVGARLEKSTMWLEGYADYPAIADDGVKDYFHSTSFRYVKISPFLDIDYEIDAVEILKLAHIQISVDIILGASENRPKAVFSYSIALKLSLC